MGVITEITVLKLFRDAVRISVQPGAFDNRIQEILELFKDRLECAAGLRLKNGNDCPYIYSCGFDSGFLQDEDSLFKVSSSAAVLGEKASQRYPGGICGLVLSGKADRSLSSVTSYGSIILNSTAEFSKIYGDTDPGKAACSPYRRAGYESAVLIPVKIAAEVAGLLQLTACTAGKFSPELVQILEESAAVIGSMIREQRKDTLFELCESELSSIYRVSDIINASYPDIDNALLKLTENIPEFFPLKKYMSAVIEYDQKKYFSSSLAEEHNDCGEENTVFSQEVELLVNNIKAGFIRIEYVCSGDNTEDVFSQKELSLLTELSHKIEDFITAVLREKELEKECKELKAIYETTPSLIVLVDEERRIIKANNTALLRAGRSFEEIVGLYGGNALCCFHSKDSLEGCGFGEFCKSDCGIREALYESLDTGKPVNRKEADFYYDSPQGKVHINLLVSTYPMRIDNKRYILAYFEDVTELRLKDAALKNSVQSYFSLVSALPDLVVREDLDYRFMYMSSNFSHYLDMPVETFVGKTKEEVGFPPDKCRFWKTVLDNVIKTKRQQEAEFDFDTIIGKRVFNWRAVPEFDADGELISIISVFRDITDNLKIREDLDEASALLKTAMDNSPAGIAIFDVPDGHLRYVNKTGLDIFDRSPDYVNNDVNLYDYFKTWGLYDLDGNVLREDDMPAVQALKYGKSLSREMLIKREDGQNRTIWTSGSPVYNKNNDITAAIVIFTDVTEQHQLNKQLKQSEKMAAIGQLAGGIAHDFNNQLTGIMGYADIITSSTSDRKILEYAGHIIKSATHSADLTQQLLAFSRKGMYFLKPVDINECIMDVISILKHSIDKKITIVDYLYAQNSIVNADISQLQNSILNLALNARDAIKDSGEIKFETSDVCLGEDYCSSLNYYLAPGDYLLIKISDNGCGISEDIRDRIFEPFFTTKNEGEGTGMGLAAVYGTIKYHKGAIELQSESGVGTTFSIYLPVMKNTIKTEGDVKNDIPKGKGCILLVDDEDVARKISTEMLTQLGYEVISQCDGEKAVEYYNLNHDKIDLVVLDMVMPVKNGYEAFLEMKEINPDVKVLISSGYSSNYEIQAALNNGAIGVLPKPFYFSELAEAMAKYI